MFNFFKKIRRSSLLTNKASRYFKYALGEILLMVIGILIALQINNWNEDRKERNREKIYLQSLRIDLLESQTELTRVIHKTDTIARTTIELLRYALDTVPMPAPAVFDSLVRGTYGYTIAMTNEGTINDISGSGDLKVIRNDSLRRMIASWDAGFKMIRERENLLKHAFQRNSDRLEKRIDIFRMANVDRNLMDASSREYILSDPEHRNGFIELISSAITLNELYREKFDNLDKMIALTQQ